MAANSPYESAAATVSNPLMTQAASSPPVDPVWRAISAETMKIPEPIIDPTTIMVESNKPRPRTNPDDSVSVTIGSITSVDIGSDIAPLLFNSRERQSPDWRLLNPPIGRLAFPVSCLGFSRLYGGRHFEILPGARAWICRTN